MFHATFRSRPKHQQSWQGTMGGMPGHDHLPRQVDVPNVGAAAAPFFGPWVVRSAFVLAAFGWGVGFYGPAVFLHQVVERTGWSLALVSSAVTLHFLFGAALVTQLPRLHRRYGVGPVALVGSLVTTVGALGWALASLPWMLFVAALASGSGWVTMGAASINAAIAPWYIRTRPAALAKAYNGASIGGVVFSPLWVALIAQLGFAGAAALIGALMVLIVAVLAHAVFSKTPQSLGQCADGDATGAPAVDITSPDARALPGRLLWRDRRFRTLAAGMAVGLFAQIGLIAHLYSLLVLVVGAQTAGWAMGFATLCSIGGRWWVVRMMPMGVDRRVLMAASYGIQLLGVTVLWLAGGKHTAFIVLGVTLFGAGIGNATSLPPLIAQVEFAPQDVVRVVATIIAFAQATYAFAPAAFGLVLATSSVQAPHIGRGAETFLLAVALVQGLAIACFMAGRKA